MKNLSKLLLLKSFIILLIAVSGFNAFGQEIAKYDYAEVIVKQKNSGELQSINLNSISSSAEKDKINNMISKLKSTSALLRYMNSENWELVDRTSVLWSTVMRFDYIFRKRKE